MAALFEEIKALQRQQEVSTRHLAGLQRDLADLQHQVETDLVQRHEKEILLEINLDNEMEALVDFSSSVRHLDDIHLHSVLLQDVLEEEDGGEDSDEVTASTRIPTLSTESQKLVSEATNVVRSHALRLRKIVDDDLESEANHRIEIESIRDRIRCVQGVIDRLQNKIVTLRKDLKKLKRLREEQLERAKREERQARIDNLLRQQHSTKANSEGNANEQKKMDSSRPFSCASQSLSSGAICKKSSSLESDDGICTAVTFRKVSQCQDGVGAVRCRSKRRSFVSKTA